MIVTYAYKGGAALKNILSDLVAILTGTTNKNLLSPDCDKVATTITATVAAGWTTTTGGLSAPETKVMPETGYYAAHPVSNGSYLVMPVYGTNKVVKSIDGGQTWQSYTLPVSLGTGFVISDVGKFEPLVWNGSYWVLIDPTQSVNYVLTSTDGETWTSRSTTTPQRWINLVWNGSIWVVTASGSTQAIVTSTDGVTWTYRATALPAAANWGRPVFANGLWVLTRNNLVTTISAQTALATSTDGITWTARTIGSFVTWTPQYLNGLWLIPAPPNNSVSNVYTSSDGITWTSRTLPATSMWVFQYEDNTYVASTFSGSTGYVAVSSDGVSWGQVLSATYLNSAYFSVSKGLWIIFAYQGSTFYTSTDGVAWTARTLPVAMSSSAPVTVFELSGVIYAFARTPQGYFVSYDGINFTYRSTWPLPGNMSNIYQDSFRVIDDIAYMIDSSLTNKLACFSYNGGETLQAVRALNLDATAYKEVLLDVSNATLLLITADDVGVNTVTNLAYNSDNLVYGQPLDLTNGGLLLVQATKEYIVVLGYRPASSLWGSTTGNGCTAVCEYTREDPWNTAANGYSSHAWIGGATFLTGMYAPRFKSGASTDAVGSVAKFTPFQSAPFPKQTLNAASLATPSAIEVRISNFADFTYGVMGGVLAGGIKQTVTNYGSNGDEMQVGSLNYKVHACGTARLLVPMQ